MKSRLILRSPAAKNRNRAAAIRAALGLSGAEFEADVKENMSASIPRGKTYKIGNITGAATAANRGLKLRKAANGKLIIGARYHRASAKGQPPARRSGRLINSIRGRFVGPFKVRVGTGVRYAIPLDDPAGLDRPFFMSRAELYRARYKENMRRAYIG